MTRRGVAVAIAMVVAGCESVPPAAVTQCQDQTVVARPGNTDILFVIDDSPTMAVQQQNLATNFDAFIQRLAASPVKNDYQIGITTTSVDFPIYNATDPAAGYTVYTRDPDDANAAPYPAGALVAKPGRPKILQASSSTLVADFVANVAVGISGAGKEQGLRAAQLAVSDRVQDGKNAGFLRPGARLAIVIVSDEDDCSDATPPREIFPWRSPLSNVPNVCHSDAEQALLPPAADYATWFRTQPIGGELRDVVVAVIAGFDPQTKQPKLPACNAPLEAYPGYRYGAFVSVFGAKGRVSDICSDFRSTMVEIAGLIDPGQTITIDEPPADGRLLAVSVARANAGATTTCKVALDGAQEAATADAVYLGPQQGRAATLTFQNACTLRQGDEVQLRLICAG